MKKAVFRSLALLTAVITLLSLSGCGTNEIKTEPDYSLQKVLKSGQMVLGLDMAFPPMGFVDDDGEIVGFDIDVAREVCSRLGIELVLYHIEWDAKEDELNNGNIDCIWNGLSITSARSQTMCLSDAYMKNELIVVVPGDSTIKGMYDLDGISVGVQSGSTAEETLVASDFNVTIVRYKTAFELLCALKDGKIKAALTDSVVAYYFILSSDETYYILSDSLGEEEYAIGFRQQDVILRNKVQQIIGEMKTDGTLAAISKKWFGSDITIVK